MKVRMKLSRHDERTLLVQTLGRMRLLRADALTDGMIREETRQKYLERMVEAASFADAIDNPEKTQPLKELIAERYNGDSVVRGYDCSQDGWWIQCEGYDEFLHSMRMLAMYLLRGGLTDPEDVFHLFQHVKYCYADDEERARDDFILPAYGGLRLPRNLISPLINSLAGNDTLMLRPHTDRMILRLEWYPDDGAKGVEETDKIIETARLLGYYGIEFRLPQQLRYDSLCAHFGNRLKSRDDGDAIFGIIRIAQNGLGNPDRLMQAIENGDRKLESIPRQELEERRRIFYSENGLTVLASADDAGIGIQRVLFSAQHGDNSTSGGIYTLQDGAATEELAAEIVAGFAKLGKISMDELNDLLSAAKDRTKALFVYAIVKLTEFGNTQEFELEAMEHGLGGKGHDEE